MRRARRLAAHSNVATVDLGGGGGGGRAQGGPRTVDRDEVLAASDVLCLLKRAVDVLAAEPNVLGLQAPLLTIGDIHGQYGDLEERPRRQRRRRPAAGAARLRRRRKLEGAARRRERRQEGRVAALPGRLRGPGRPVVQVLFYLLALKVRYPRKVPAPRQPRVAELHGPLRLPRLCNRTASHAYNQCCSVFE